jgi:hypothetical protein
MLSRCYGFSDGISFSPSSQNGRPIKRKKNHGNSNIEAITDVLMK